MKIIKIKYNNISYQVHPYTELFGVMAIIADEDSIYRNAGKEYYNRNYRDKIIEQFKAYKEHKSIKLLTKYSKKHIFNYDAPCLFFLELLDNVGKFSNYICKTRLALMDYEYEEFIDSIEDFIIISNFESFYKENEGTYTKSIQSFIRNTKNYSPELFLFNLIGKKSDSLAINLMHSVTNSNYGLKTEKYLYVCVPPCGEGDIKGEPDFSCDLAYITTLILHEFAHSFINPLAHKYDHMVENLDKDIFKELFKNPSIGNDIYNGINETIIRSMECLYLEKFFPEKKQEYIDKYSKMGFIHINMILEKLNFYEINRKKYPTIDRYYPELLESFVEI